MGACGDTDGGRSGPFGGEWCVVAANGRPRQPRARAEAAALPRRRGAAPSRPRSRRFVPSRRSVLVGAGLLVLAACLYVAARQTSVFAVRSIDVVGAPPSVAAQVRQALAPVLGTSLVGLDGTEVERRVDALPTVVSSGYDRAFPNTLRIDVVPEHPVVVLRRAGEAWLVSARGRVMARVPLDAAGWLPRTWVPAATHVALGDTLPPDGVGTVARALALAADFPVRIRLATFAHDALAFDLASGLELRLGDPSDILLKLAVARHALRALPRGSTYLDVGLPGRPVSGSNPQVSTGG